MKSKKELKAAYKELKFPMGVFQIKNKTNGKLFIDSSLNMPAKWNRHQAQLKFGSHRNKALQKEWNHFGANAFEYAILEEIPFEDATVDYGQEVEILEEIFLEKLQPYGGNGYNTSKSKRPRK